MAKITWEYLAGFTDGEGNFAIVGRGPRVTWGQNDKNLMDCLANFLREEGFHPNYYSVSPKPPKRPNRIYLLNLCRQMEVLKIIDILEPLMILKHNQCQKVRIWLKEHIRSQNYDPINMETIRIWINAGYSARWMGKQMRCSQQKIYNAAKKVGLKFKPAGGKSINGKREPNVRW